jgi:acetyl esterase/lipase
MPLSVSRTLSISPLIDIPGSRRFAVTRTQLLQKVSTPTFTGFWICKGPPNITDQDVRKCDFVLYYIHGGAYRTNHPATTAVSWLRVAELLSRRGFSVAVFALNYSLAPETQFPIPARQAQAAYRYLLDDENISPSKLILTGDSAGAHLAIHFLHTLPRSGLPKPAGALLIAPWIDLRCSNEGSYIQNATNDFLARSVLIEASHQYISRVEEEKNLHLVDLNRPRPPGSRWVDIMPPRVRIDIGSHDLFLDEVEAFTDNLKVGGVEIEFNIKPGGCHIWQFLDDVLDNSKYLSTTGEPSAEVMSGATAIADGILAVIPRK